MMRCWSLMQQNHAHEHPVIVEGLMEGIGVAVVPHGCPRYDGWRLHGQCSSAASRRAERKNESRKPA
jgi:hypothetical protein